jgi:acyl-homoserine-lactone acylase
LLPLSLQSTALSFLIFICFASTSHAQEFRIIDPDDVLIQRDHYGIAHIYGPTDADVAYGLAWANAEDAFPIVQDLVLTAKGMMGEVYGKEGAIRDYLLYAFDLPGLVDRRYESDNSLEYRVYLDAYTQGLNAYAEDHPDEILLEAAFPVSAEELYRAHLFVAAFLVRAPQEVQKIVEGFYDDYSVLEDLKIDELSLQSALDAFEMDPNHQEFAGFPMSTSNLGSNAYAFAPSMTEDGKTYLAINPHLQMEGPFSFYEAHLHSEEGLNVHGGLFNMSPSVGLGNNENLGWALTFNGLDLVDTYELQMHPKKKHYYLLDGEWKQLRKEKIKLKVKLNGLLTIKVSKKAYWSEHGPTFKQGKRYFAVRFGLLQNTAIGDQFYQMNKARNLEEFKAALNLRGIPRFNVIYADKEGHIFYICNGQLPDRYDDQSIDWEYLIPGHRQDLIWDEFVAIDSLPQVLDPESGFVFNTNNTPFSCTGPQDNPDACNMDRYPNSAGYKLYENNRSLRFIELVEHHGPMQFDDFKAIKFDCQYPCESAFLASLEPLFNLDTEALPHLKSSIESLRNWDLRADAESTGATLFALTVDHLFKKYQLSDAAFYSGFEAEQSDMIEALEFAQAHLIQFFESMEVPLEEFQRISRGEMDMPLPGFADMMAANYCQQREEDGRYEVFIGDSYTQFVIFDSELGAIHMESLQPYGVSSRSTSPHYTDQMDLFSAQRTKKISLESGWLEAQIEQSYHPGSVSDESSASR